ncbi:UDP-N-acetylglucosamine--N-acetylmuramyl-(pentapeptide) pyrophosphoryl-undecaprenol N-acetylglucosaminetransferase [Striga asiatica]|uniref:UDP-N-acetylglucosamine--N-acetylmuramyl-(Pentapeptide) pyrophosphoryl-undecaprenol N-acetylglucosaminetransferase n=1 Tax=Striga asiatica TaxID=4170 RepID=A0A5A7QUX4_STRAF|nr:UDP-N-acetylglucosamine--N-acetylmuramyl-(pentapeptide) pyrophosphoryl-undecaprenol N-acetylglucosaminetransferase [Striga asiatica]
MMPLPGSQKSLQSMNRPLRLRVGERRTSLLRQKLLTAPSSYPSQRKMAARIKSPQHHPSRLKRKWTTQERQSIGESDRPVPKRQSSKIESQTGKELFSNLEAKKEEFPID